MTRKIVALFTLVSIVSLSAIAEESQQLLDIPTQPEDVTLKIEEEAQIKKDSENTLKTIPEQQAPNTQTEAQTTQTVSSQHEQKTESVQETEQTASPIQTPQNASSTNTTEQNQDMATTEDKTDKSSTQSPEENLTTSQAQPPETPEEATETTIDQIDQKDSTVVEKPSIVIPKKPVLQENPTLYTDPQAILIDEFGELPEEVFTPNVDSITSENTPSVENDSEQEMTGENAIPNPENTGLQTTPTSETTALTIDTSHFERRRKAFAFGIDISGMGAVTYFTIADFLKETLEVNLSKLAQAIPQHGYSVASSARTKVYLDIYVKSKYEFGLFANVDAKVFTTLPKDLINFLAKGNKNTPTRSGDIIADSKAFADTGIFFGMRVGNFKFRLSSAYFVPLVWVNQQKVHYTFSNDPNTGKIVVRLTGDLELYSPILPLIVKNKKGNSSSFNISDTLKRGGLDVDFDGTYEFAPYAQLNFGIKHIPFVPSRMNQGMFITADATVETKGLLDYGLQYLKGTTGSFFADGKSISDLQQQFKKITPHYSGREAKIMRPLKMYVSADIYPFKNRFLILTPRLGMNFFKPIYVDFGVKVESSIYNILGFIFDMGREDRVWKNKLGFYVDSRVFRLEVAASATGGTFVDSFRGSGVQLDVGLVLLGF